MNFLRNLTRRVLQLPRLLTRYDRLALAVFGLVLVVGMAGLLNNRRAKLIEQPVPGGMITVGIVADSQAALERDIETLTHAGLIKFNQKGELEPSLAKRWEIQDEGKVYIFELVDGLSATQAQDTIKNQKNGLSKVELTTPDDKTLKLQLKQPFAPLLSDLTKPLLPLGPYEIKKRSSDTLALTSRKTPLGEPLIKTFLIQVFTSQKSLTDALNQERVDIAIATGQFPDRYNKFSLELPRHQVVFLNLARPVFNQKKTRQDLKTDARLEGLEFQLTTVDSTNLSSLGQDFVAKAISRGAKANLRLVPQLTLEQEIIPKRDFDALLVNVDFGRDPDSYSFWHSSQAGTGQNLSGFVNKRADRLLEDGRLTTDPAKRQEIYAELQRILNEEVPAIFLRQEVLQYNVNKRIKGVVVGKGMTPADRFGNVSQWYVKTKKVKK